MKNETIKFILGVIDLILLICEIGLLLTGYTPEALALFFLCMISSSMACMFDSIRVGELPPHADVESKEAKNAKRWICFLCISSLVASLIGFALLRLKLYNYIDLTSILVILASINFTRVLGLNTLYLVLIIKHN